MGANVRTRARLSINKLGEYLEASAGRRERILRDQKFPKDFITLYYKEASDAICKYTGSGFDDGVLGEQYQDLGDKPTTTIRQDKRLKDCIEALEKFQNLVEDDLLTRVEAIEVIPAPVAPKNGSLSIEDVEVSLRPEFYLLGQNRRGNDIKGLLKLYLSRNQPLSTYAAEAIATVSLEHLNNLSKPAGKPDPNLILVVDVFAESVYPAPKSSKKLWKDIAASCREIARLWDQVEDSK